MTDTDWVAYVDVVAPTIPLVVPPDCRAAVAEHLALLEVHMARVMAVGLDAADEPAPVFRP